MTNLSLQLRLLIFITVITGLAVISIYYPGLNVKVVQDIYEKEDALVLNVIDGDTIKTSNGTIRLLGINTPERGRAYYMEAKNYLTPLINQTIQIQRDKEDLDKYGRKLRYVFYDGQFVNGLILEQGLGTTLIYEELIYEKQLIRAEEQVKLSKVGLWGGSNDECSKCIVLNELNPVDEFFVLENVCEHNCLLEGWSVKDDANHIFKMEGISSGEVVRYDSKGKIWNNDGDRFFMRDGDGGLVIFYEY